MIVLAVVVGRVVADDEGVVGGMLGCKSLISLSRTGSACCVWFVSFASASLWLVAVGSWMTLLVVVLVSAVVAGGGAGVVAAIVGSDASSEGSSAIIVTW